MDKKTLLALGVILLLAAIVFVVAFWLTYQKGQQAPQAQTPSVSPQSSDAPVVRRFNAVAGSKCEYKTPENTFYSLEEASMKPSDVCYLIIRDKQYTELPASIKDFTEVVYIDANGNKLTSLPSEITQLTNLETLLLSGNNFSVVPRHLSQLSNLRTLHLVKNPISEAELNQARMDLPSMKITF